MYLKLSVAGHLTIFLTRTRGPFWSIRPAKILWIAVLGTQTIATLIAVYGLFMAPLGWKWAGFVWGYAIAWALVNDRIKLLAYKIFDRVKADPKTDAIVVAKPDAKGEPKPEAKADAPKTDAKADAPTPEAKAEPKPKAKADEPKPGTKAPSDLTQQVAKRAYEIYEQRAGNDGTAVQDWKKAELEIRNDKAKGEPKTDAKADQPKPDAKTDAPNPDAKADQPKPDAKTDAPNPDAKADQPTPEVKTDAPKPDAKADEPKTNAKTDQPTPEAKTDAPKPDAKADEPKTDAKADQPTPEAKDKTQPDATPQLVKRVHQLYEQFGREDVQTVQNFEKAEPELQSNESKK
jgi:H+-transporting ATPase